MNHVNPIMSRKRVSEDFSTSSLDFENNNKKQKTSMTEHEIENNVHSTLAWQWATIMKDGLLQSVKNDLQAEYSPTGVYDLLGPPNLNTHLKYSLNQTCMQADQRYVNMQEQITSALVGIGKIIASALTCNDSRLIDADILIDVAMLLGNIHHDISLQRRSAVISAFDLEGITDLSQVHETLFGKKLMRIIRSAKILPIGEAEDDKSKITPIESVGNEPKKPEKTVNDSTADGSKNLEKNANVSVANRSENTEKNADENLQKKSQSDAEDAAKSPSTENKDSEANKKSQESSERVERSEENENGTKSLEAESAQDERLPSGPQGARENDSREKTISEEASTERVKSTDKNVKSPEKIVESTLAVSAKSANTEEEDLPRAAGTGSEKNGKELSSEAKFTHEMINPVETNAEDKSKSNVNAENINETADIILLEVKNASLRVIEEMDVALKKKLEALQMDDACVKPEKKKTAREGIPQGDFPGLQEVFRLKSLYHCHVEGAAKTMSHALAGSTMSQYSAPIRCWWKFCKDHNYNVFEGTEQNVTQFFVEYDHQISSYSALSRWKTALGRFTECDLSKSGAISDYLKGYKSLRGEKSEKK